MGVENQDESKHNCFLIHSSVAFMSLSPTSHLGLVGLSLLLSSTNLLVRLKNNNKNIAVQYLFKSVQYAFMCIQDYNILFFFFFENVFLGMQKNQLVRRSENTPNSQTLY